MSAAPAPQHTAGYGLPSALWGAPSTSRHDCFGSWGRPHVHSTVPLTVFHHIASNFYARSLLHTYYTYLAGGCVGCAGYDGYATWLLLPVTQLHRHRPSSSFSTIPTQQALPWCDRVSAYTTPQHTTPHHRCWPTVPFSPSHPSFLSFVLRPSSLVPSRAGIRGPSLGPESDQAGRARGNKTPTISAKPPPAVAQFQQAKLLHPKYGRQVRIAASYAYCTARLGSRQVQASHGAYIHITHRLDPNETPVCAGCVVDTTLSPSPTQMLGFVTTTSGRCGQTSNISRMLQGHLGLNDTTPWRWSG